MKGYFLNVDPKQISSVYDETQRAFLRSKFSVPEKVYNKNEISALSDADVIFTTWGMPCLSVDEIKDNLPSLKAVFYAAGSVKYFAKPFFDAGVRIFSAWKANAIPVAECAVSEILLSAKGFWYLTERCKSDYEKMRIKKEVFPGNYGAKIGILGYGAIARLVVGELLRHNLEIYVFAPEFGDEEERKTGAHKASLEWIFSHCDVISNHIADNTETKGILGKNLLYLLSPYSTFINTGRGAQLDERALAEKLELDETVTAVLDVTCPEPPVKDSPLYKLKNVILTPHFAGSSGQEVHRLAQYMIDDALRYNKNEPVLYEVVVSMLSRMA